MRRNKWRVNRNGELIYGYKCYNQLNNGSKKVRDEAGVSSEGYCDLSEICDWKMELMARTIFQELWNSYKEAIREAYRIYSQCYRTEKQDSVGRQTTLLAQLEKSKKKLESLTNMRMEGELTKEEYQDYRQKLNSEISSIEEELLQIETSDPEQHTPTGKLTFEQLAEILSVKLDFTKQKLDRQFLEHIIYRIVPITQDEFAWYLNFLPREGEWVSEGKELCSLSIGYDAARAYRKELKGMLRKNQWRDLTIHVYA